MRMLMILGLLLISHVSFSKSFDVKCYSDNTVIYEKTVQDVDEIDGFLVMREGDNVIFLNGNCIIKYAKPIRHKRK